MSSRRRLLIIIYIYINAFKVRYIRYYRHRRRVEVEVRCTYDKNRPGGEKNDFISTLALCHRQHDRISPAAILLAAIDRLPLVVVKLQIRRTKYSRKKVKLFFFRGDAGEIFLPPPHYSTNYSILNYFFKIHVGGRGAWKT